MNANNNNELDPKFKYEVSIHPGGENIKLCFACGTCTAGCPVSEIDPEFNPRKIIRQVLLGMRKETLSSPIIWRCAQCYSCTAKCPQNVKFREVLRALREMAVEEGYAEPDCLEKIEEVGRLAQKIRRNLANALATDRSTYDELKKKAEQLAQ